MIVCWRWDSATDLERAGRAVSLIPQLLTGTTKRFSRDDWWTFYEAIDNYPHRTTELDRLLKLSKVALGLPGD